MLSDRSSLLALLNDKIENVDRYLVKGEQLYRSNAANKSEGVQEIPDQPEAFWKLTYSVLFPHSFKATEKNVNGDNYWCFACRKSYHKEYRKPPSEFIGERSRLAINLLKMGNLEKLKNLNLTANELTSIVDGEGANLIKWAQRLKIYALSHLRREDTAQAREEIQKIQKILDYFYLLRRRQYQFLPQAENNDNNNRIRATGILYEAIECHQSDEIIAEIISGNLGYKPFLSKSSSLKSLPPLGCAIYHGLSSVVKLLLDQGIGSVDKSYKIYDTDYTLLGLAIRLNQLEIVKIILNDIKTRPNQYEDKAKLIIEALTLSIGFEQRDITDLLLKFSLENNIDIKNNHSLLETAVRKNDIKTVKFLVINCKADVNIQVGQYNTPLLHVAAIGNHKGMVEYLLEAGADVNANSTQKPADTKETNIKGASGSNKSEEDDSEVESTEPTQPAQRSQQLLAAVKAGNLEELQRLDVAAGELVTVVDDSRNSILKIAQIKIRRAKKDLKLGITQAKEDLVKYQEILDYFYILRQNQYPISGMQSEKENIVAVTHRLHEAISCHQSLEVISQLIDDGTFKPSISQFAKVRELPPLACAIIQELPEVVQLFLDKNVGYTDKIYRLDKINVSPLDLAVRQKNLEIVELILKDIKTKSKNYGDVTNLISQALSAAIELEAVEMANLFFKFATENALDVNQDNKLLHDAVANGDVKAVRFLVGTLKMDINIQIGKYTKTTLLHEAAKKNDKEMVKCLLELGADVHATNYMGVTAWYEVSIQRKPKDKRKANDNRVVMEEEDYTEVMDILKTAEKAGKHSTQTTQPAAQTTQPATQPAQPAVQAAQSTQHSTLLVLPDPLVSKISIEMPPMALRGLCKTNKQLYMLLAAKASRAGQSLWEFYCYLYFTEKDINKKNAGKNATDINWYIVFGECYKKEDFKEIPEPSRLILVLAMLGNLEELKEKKLTADQLRSIKDANGVSLLQWVQRFKHQNILDYFFELLRKEDVAVQPSQDHLLAAIQCHQSKDYIEKLLEGMTENTKNDLFNIIPGKIVALTSPEESPLCVAVQQGSIEIVRLLLDKGANLDEQIDYYDDKSKETTHFSAINEAVKVGHVDILKVLLEKMDPKDRNFYINIVDSIQTAFKLNLFEILKELVEFRKEELIAIPIVDRVHTSQLTNLVNDSLFKYFSQPTDPSILKCIELLIGVGIQIERDTLQYCLYYAVDQRNIKGIDWLVKQGVDVTKRIRHPGNHATDAGTYLRARQRRDTQMLNLFTQIIEVSKSGNTLLHEAAIKSDLNVINKFLPIAEKKLDVDVKNDQQKTASQLMKKPKLQPRENIAQHHAFFRSESRLKLLEYRSTLKKEEVETIKGFGCGVEFSVRGIQSITIFGRKFDVGIKKEAKETAANELLNLIAMEDEVNQAKTESNEEKYNAQLDAYEKARQTYENTYEKEINNGRLEQIYYGSLLHKPRVK